MNEEEHWLTRRFEPLSELSEAARKAVLGGLVEDWRNMPKENKVRYLKRGGLESCEAVGIKVPNKLLRAAGLLDNPIDESPPK